eukprot:3173816-Pyramimonas_sp.AAC.1
MEWEDDLMGEAQGAGVGEEVQPPPHPHASGRGRGGTRGRGSGRGRGGRGRSSSAPATTTKCFAQQCNEKKKANSKFCPKHHRSAENIKNQAERDGELQTYEQIFNDPVKADQALEQFDRDNCDGRFRKKLIEWGQWKRQFGVKVSTKTQGIEEWLDVAEYVDLRTRNMPEGPDKEQLKIAKTKEFEEMCNAPGIEKEGEWPNTRIWVFVKKQRIGEVERFINTGFEEASKQMKDMAKDEKDQLK